VAALELFLNAIDRTIAFLQARAAGTGQREKDIAAAWNVVRSAVTKTRAYIADQNKPAAKRNRKEEREIAESWNAVGLVIRGLGGAAAQSLCDQCFAKADYWADPHQWELANPDRDISLDRVENALNRMLRASERKR
jgi:hypothetical protein